MFTYINIFNVFVRHQCGELVFFLVYKHKIKVWELNTKLRYGNLSKLKVIETLLNSFTSVYVKLSKYGSHMYGVFPF